MIYSYRVYGLNCVASAPIAGLWLGQFPQGMADLVIEVGSAPPRWVEQARSLPESLNHKKPSSEGLTDSQPCVTVFGANQFFQLTYRDGTQFVIDGAAKRLWGAYLPPLSEEDFEVYLRGPALGFALRLRGITALHASAIVFQNKAVLFCGPSGCGKSTIAAALSLRQILVLSDDIAALKTRNISITEVEPGYPRVCLWPESVSGLFGVADALPRLTPGWEKRYLLAKEGFSDFGPPPLPLAVIYILTTRSGMGEPRIEEVTPRDALLELVRNTYMNWFLDQEQRANEFGNLSEIVENVPIRRLIIQTESWRVDDLCNTVLKDAVALIGGCHSIEDFAPR